MKVLVLGAGGLLGSRMVRECLDQSMEVTGTYHSDQPAFDIPLEQHDIRDTEEFESLLDRWKPDVVVNCAAMTDVDGCETESDVAVKVNGEAPGKVATICGNRNIRFVHVSTDYVFDGRGTESYDELAEPNPIQEYGKSKLEGEKRVRETDSKAIIVRLSFVYGVRGDTGKLVGFPAWVRDSLRSGDKVPLFVDQRITPSRAGQTAGTIFELVEAGMSGLYHVASRTCLTPYHFGKRIAAIADANEALLRESQRSSVSRDANRPQNTCLDVSKVMEDLNRKQPTIKEDLRSIEAQFSR